MVFFYLLEQTVNWTRYQQSLMDCDTTILIIKTMETWATFLIICEI